MARTIGTGADFMRIRVTGFLAKRRGRQVLAAIERGLVNGAVAALPVVKSLTPINSGYLRNSLQVQFRKLPRRAMVTSYAAHAGVMAKGRHPGRKFPPMGPIMAWVQAKLSVAANKVRSVAFLIARNIATFGIGVTRGRRNWTGKWIPSLVQRTGLGNMFERAGKQLGAAFFAQHVRDEVERLH